MSAQARAAGRRIEKLLIIVLALLTAMAAVVARWEPAGSGPDGLQVEKLALPDTKLPMLRLTTTSTSTPAELSAAAWELRDDGVQVRHLDERVVLSETKNTRRVYMRVAAPVVGKRECVLDLARTVEPRTGAVHIAFRARAPDEPSGHGVRPFEQLRGEWRFTPAPDGKTRVEYRVVVDPGGTPAMFVAPMERDIAVQTVREVVSRAASRDLRAGARWPTVSS